MPRRTAWKSPDPLKFGLDEKIDDTIRGTIDEDEEVVLKTHARIAHRARHAARCRRTGERLDRLRAKRSDALFAGSARKEAG
jgi:hypothetical protein